MTDQIDKLLSELNAEAREKLGPVADTIVPLGNSFGIKPPKHFNVRSQTDEFLLDFIINLARTQWPWEVCKRAFPHDIDAAARLYRKIHGKDPP